MAEPSGARLGRGAADGPPGGEVGGRRVLLVAAIVVVVVLGAALLTSVLPADLQRIVFHTPLAIFVLIAGTGWLLWRIARRPST